MRPTARLIVMLMPASMILSRLFRIPCTNDMMRVGIAFMMDEMLSELVNPSMSPDTSMTAAPMMSPMCEIRP